MLAMNLAINAQVNSNHSIIDDLMIWKQNLIKIWMSKMVWTIPHIL